MRVEDLICIYIKQAEKQTSSHYSFIFPPSLPPTESEAAAYEFTTLTCIPGNIIYNDTKIQLLDLPGKKGAREGGKKGSTTQLF